MNLNEDNIFSFVYQKTTSEKKNQTQPDIKFPNKLPTEDLTDILKKNTEALEISLKKNINQKKERNSKSQKIKNNKNRKKQKQQNSSYKNGIADEEINYLFTLLKDGNLDIITEITLRKALNNCGMTDIEDEFVKVKKVSNLVSQFLLK